VGRRTEHREELTTGEMAVQVWEFRVYMLRATRYMPHVFGENSLGAPVRERKGLTIP
jgi:hypothetical protein